MAIFCSHQHYIYCLYFRYMTHPGKNTGKEHIMFWIPGFKNAPYKITCFDNNACYLLHLRHQLDKPVFKHFRTIFLFKGCIEKQVYSRMDANSNIYREAGLALMSDNGPIHTPMDYVNVKIFSYVCQFMISISHSVRNDTHPYIWTFRFVMNIFCYPSLE